MSLNRLEPPSIGSVAALLAMDRTTLSAALKPLEQRGLLAVSVSVKDRPSRLLALTPAGRAAFRQSAADLETRASVDRSGLVEERSGSLAPRP
jgi:DNA-binding MarR family transcriptional regulator